MDRYIGTLLDNRYEIQEVIGSGGMAVVYKALCHRLNRPVAIKILKDEFTKDEDFRRRFHGESQAVAMLSHPNIVSVYDVSHAEGADYIVMELIDGITLKQYMEQKGVLNWRESLHFVTQICKALEHAHSRGIIHRDIKPHNIMILKDGSVKVADFGIARVGTARQTLMGEALGSVHYISPEQAKGGQMDSRADLYSLGVVLYEMLTGRPPFDGDTPVSVAIQHISGIPESPRSINPSIPEGLEQITMRAMDASLSSRYPSATQMLQDLESFRQNPSMVFGKKPVHRDTEEVKQTPTPAPKKEPAPKPKSKKKKKKHTAIIAGIVCIGLAVTGLILLLSYLMKDTFHREADILVPDLYLMSAEEAQNRYKDSFEFEIIFQVPEGDIDEGLIINQKPKAEMPVKKGATITITVSTGARKMSMPNVVNYSLSDAKAALQDYDVFIREIKETSETLKNYIIRTEPEAGQPLTPGQNVILFVSAGNEIETVPMPRLEGSDLDDALQALRDCSLERGTITYIISDVPKGHVVSQSVEAGEDVPLGTVVDLVVSEGQDLTVQVPVILAQPRSQLVDQYKYAELSVNAVVYDGGQLSYEWFVSYTNSTADFQPLATGSTLVVDTKNTGTASYYCKITNTLNGDTVSTYTDTVEVTVDVYGEKVTKYFTVPIPQGEGRAELAIKLDGVDYISAFTVARDEPSVTVMISAKGRRMVDIYVDGILVLSSEEDFS